MLKAKPTRLHKGPLSPYWHLKLRCRSAELILRQEQKAMRHAICVSKRTYNEASRVDLVGFRERGTRRI